MANYVRNKETGGTWYDLYSTYGIRLVKGAYAELSKFPPMKSYIKNESRLEDGVRYIAKAQYAKFNERTVGIRFIVEGATSAARQNNLDSFLTLMKSGMFELKITALNSVFRLVYSSCRQMNIYRSNHSIFELELIEPNPADRAEFQSS